MPLRLDQVAHALPRDPAVAWPRGGRRGELREELRPERRYACRLVGRPDVGVVHPVAEASDACVAPAARPGDLGQQPMASLLELRLRPFRRAVRRDRIALHVLHAARDKRREQRDRHHRDRHPRYPPPSGVARGVLHHAARLAWPHDRRGRHVCINGASTRAASSAHQTMKLETLAVHAGHDPDPATGAVTPPIHLSTTFARDADGALPHGWLYTRYGNPNRDALERCLATLEGGAAAAVFSSGNAATMTVLQALSPGDHVILAEDAYT